jgi:hypothetical protein
MCLQRPAALVPAPNHEAVSQPQRLAEHGDYEVEASDPANALGGLAGKAHLKYCG